MANYDAVTMTRRGTVLFMRRLCPWFLVTADDLDTGHITIVESSATAKSGNPSVDGLAICGLDLAQVEWDEVGGGDEKNSDLDMTQPVIDILEEAKARREFLFGFDGACFLGVSSG
ncbi:uncharacterized protein ACLA_050520 [Aspergillus clavatus NRRL 1]|uniref:Uncharacterized protein n=1 Tax=Aspergillus clavatus (strain ATCC 1007 / CBS 513.65 / DSM 816 / NCTC 3887 / NRRL 1 / QM 1276 / 107) TaxID=344612 RepID=A1CI75_ASPCL|nr:uncharacterized protein ACLA_050520 [Aspergillus clavatus NRRL 1]EAW10580.1 hypothetical protein ACLA_050520 [Aspergillus clavatus NRRL 1]